MTNEEWSFFDRSPKHPEFRIGDYCSIEKDGARQLAYISGMTAPSVIGAPWQLDIETLAGHQMRVPDSEVKRFTHNEASLADVIRLGFFSFLPSPASRNSIAKLSDETLVQFFVNLCSDVGRFLNLHPDHVARNIPKLRPSSPSEKQVLAVSRFLAEYGLNYFDCFRKELEKKEEPAAPPFPIFGAVYPPRQGGNKLAVTKLEFNGKAALGKKPVSKLDLILVTFTNIATGYSYQGTARVFLGIVHNEPELTTLEPEAQIEKLPVWQKGEPEAEKTVVPPNLNVKRHQVYPALHYDSKQFQVLDTYYIPDLNHWAVTYVELASGSIFACSDDQFVNRADVAHPVEADARYRLCRVETQPQPFSEKVEAGNVYQPFCETEPVWVQKVSFDMELDRWLVVYRKFSNPEAHVVTLRRFLQTNSNGKRSFTRLAQTINDYFKMEKK